MARRNGITERWGLLMRYLLASPEWRDYRRLFKQVLVVVLSFISLGLLFGLAADVLPMLLHL